MSFYSKYILPHLIHYACDSNRVFKQRQKIIPNASGIVLEIGIGSGLNLPLYQFEKIDQLIGLDPSSEVWDLNENEILTNFRFIHGSSESIPLADCSIDMIVSTYTLCSIHHVSDSFREFRRVLKPDGRILFFEHGVSPDRSIKKWQNRLTPIWKTCGGGCHLNRNIPMLFQTNGFILESLAEGYIKGWRPATYNYWGSARLQETT